MMRLPHVLPAAVLCWLLAASAALSAPQVPVWGSLDVCSAILYDFDRGAVLFEQNADQAIAPASLTKVMSMFLALDSIAAGKVRLDSRMTVSGRAAGTGGSRMGLREGENVTLERLLTGMAVSSGNDASEAVAELLGGSVSAFVAMMNAKARSLGMNATTFATPHGLPAPGQTTTARDMLILANAYLRAHPEALRFHNQHTLNHRGRVSWNKNPLLGQYPGGDGLKTGWVRASGHNLIFTAARNGRRLLAVILGAPDSMARGVEAFRLLDAGFAVCANSMPTVAAALDALPRDAYHPDVRAMEKEARALYPGQVAAHAPRKARRGKASARGFRVGKRGKSQHGHVAKRAAGGRQSVQRERARRQHSRGQAVRRVAPSAS